MRQPTTRLTRRQRTAAIVLATIALGFLTLDLGGGSLQNAHGGVRGFFGALYRGTDGVIGPVRRWVQGVPSAGTHESEIRDLRAENAKLRGQVQAEKLDRADAKQIDRLDRAGTVAGYSVLPGRVVAFGPGQGFDWTVTLAVGRSDGVRPGQTVTDGAGLAGRVLSVDTSSAVVLLAADPGSGVGVRDTRSGELGVATGAGTSGFTFTPLDPHASVKPGDTLVSGPGGASTFVAGLAVGTVASVRTSADGTTTATVMPAASPTTVDVLGVLVTRTVAADGDR
ncbi:rod shape-determining protein MreC [Jatrophihabitans fulvus]